MRKSVVRILPFGVALLLFLLSPYLAAQSKEQSIQTELKDWYEIYSDILEERGEEEKEQLELAVRTNYAGEIKKLTFEFRVFAVFTAGVYGFALWGIPAWKKYSYLRQRRLLFALLVLLFVAALSLFLCASRIALFIQSEKIKGAETITENDYIFQTLYIQLEEQDGLDELESFFRVMTHQKESEDADSPLMEKYWGPKYLDKVEGTLRGTFGIVAVLAGGGMWLLFRKREKKDLSGESLE